MHFEPEDIIIDFRHNLVKHIDLSNFKDSALNSSKDKESKKVQKFNLKLGNNPMQCDCRLADFLPFIKGKVIEGTQKYFKFLIEDLYCDGPEYMANKEVKSLKPKDIKCDWFPTNNTDACSGICNCWQFPKERKIVANCSYRKLADIPNLVGKYNNWTTELNLSGNLLELIQLKQLKSNTTHTTNTTNTTKLIQLIQLKSNTTPFLKQ